MKTRFHKIGRAFIKIFIIIVAAILALLIISTAVNQILTAVEKGKYKPPGVMVQVGGRGMHIYSEGSGEKTIVLLSGYGTGSPVLDFAPLTKELAKTYKVAVVENFGYGWSDKAKTPRTVQNIVEETRTALGEAGYKPPYILMPHSISGLYSLYYANTYPQEVAGIACIDTSVPEQFSGLPIAGMSPLASLKTFTGLVRIATKLDPVLVSTGAPEGTYTPETLKLMRLMFCWHADNASLVGERNHIPENAETVKNMKIPASVPVLFFLSQDSVTVMVSKGMDWRAMHLALVSDGGRANCRILEGHHYLHRQCAAEMAADVHQFFVNAPQQ